MIRNVVFDLDGTLVDSRPGIEAAARRAVEEALPGLALPPIAPYIGPPIATVLRRALPEASDAAIEAAVARFRLAYDGGEWRGCHLYAGVAETLDALRAAGLRLFIATNKPALAARRITTALGLAEAMVAIASPDSAVPPFASKAETLADLIARHGLAPEETLLVGDAEDDREAAFRCGTAFAAARWGYGGVGGATELSAIAELASLVGEGAARPGNE